MHLTAINQFYAPHPSATSQLLTELCEGLAARGHRVTVVAAGEGRAPMRPQERNGVEVVRVPATSLGKRTLAHRALDYASFYAGAFAALLDLERRRRARPDVHLALTTPPLIAMAPQLVGLWRRTPVVQLVQDLYPDVAVALGALPADGALHKLWAASNRLSLGRAARVVALSDAMAERIGAHGVPRSRIEVIPNWALAELDEAPRAALGTRGRLEYGLGDRFVVMYSGNLGAGHRFDTLIAAAERLRDREDIVFLVVGDGVRRAELEREVRDKALDKVRLFPLAPRERLAESLAAADLHVITMRDGLEGLIVPSKLYGILAAARPALFIGPRRDGIAATLTQGRCGLAIDGDDVDGVTQAIVSLAADRQRCAAMGERGRALIESELSRERAIDRYERLLEGVSRRDHEGPASVAGTRAKVSA